MKTVKNHYTIEPFCSKIMSQYFGTMRMGVFDIETLGLNPLYAPLILSGMMQIEPDGSACVTQYFAEDPSDEPLILECLRRDLEDVDYVVTYNGKHFDLPFLEKRVAKLGLAPFARNFYNFDLYLVLNGYSQIKYVLKNLRQKTVEEYMGLDNSRDDLISGAESVDLYNAYWRCPDGSDKSALMEKILLHNHDDLLQLYKLLPILKQVDIHKAMNGLGFPVFGINGWPALEISRAKTLGRDFVIAGRYYAPAFSYISYDDGLRPYSCEFAQDVTFIFKLPLDKHKGNSFINLGAYLSDYAAFKKYPCYMGGFLLANPGRDCPYLELNMFAQSFVQNFMDNTVCPLNIL